MGADRVSNYFEAGATVSHLVAAIPAARWTAPALGQWDVRSLVGHTSRALTTVITYLGQPADHIDLAEPEDYYASAYRAQASSTSRDIVERGRRAGRDLGDDPAAEFAKLLDLVTVRLAPIDLDFIVRTVAGGMTVNAYLPTRTFELVVHGMDIAEAVDLPIHFTPAVLDEACQLAARIAVRTDRGPQMLLALTARTGLPTGFSVVG